ncbi:MAG: helical backbone metal receptor, partial [Nonlabens sp.]|nr:helical backbone metal receptor [Nonlabens sp.]
SMVNAIKIAFNGLDKKKTPVKALYLIWKDPYMSVGDNTFINDMMQHAGFENVCASLSRYPELTVDAMVALQPEVVLLSSEPYEFTSEDEHLLISAFAKANLTTKILRVDGEVFSWYGSRLLKAPEAFKVLSADVLT